MIDREGELRGRKRVEEISRTGRGEDRDRTGREDKAIS